MKWIAILWLAAESLGSEVPVHASTEIYRGSGSIRSSNFLAEFGSEDNSSWKFESRDWRSYALELQIKHLKLFHWNSKERVCLGSYNLTIDEEQVDCDLFIHPVSQCRVFYNSHSCGNLSDISRCEIRKLTRFPLTIRYESDGRRAEGIEDEDEIWGFDLRYRFIPCPTRQELSQTTEISTAHEISTTHEDRKRISQIYDRNQTIAKIEPSHLLSSGDDTMAAPLLLFVSSLASLGFAILLLVALVASFKKIRARATKRRRRRPSQTVLVGGACDVKTRDVEVTDGHCYATIEERKARSESEPSLMDENRNEPNYYTTMAKVSRGGDVTRAKREGKDEYLTMKGNV